MNHGIGAETAGKPAQHEKQRHEQPDDDQVEHLVWREELRFAFRVGIDVQTMCGQWVEPWDYDARLDPRQEVELIGEAVPVYEPQDCHVCQRVYSHVAGAHLLDGTTRS